MNGEVTCIGLNGLDIPRTGGGGWRRGMVTPTEYREVLRWQWGEIDSKGRVSVGGPVETFWW